MYPYLEQAPSKSNRSAPTMIVDCPCILRATAHTPLEAIV